MLKVFQTEILDPGNFIVTLELVPGRYSTGKSVDAVIGVAKDSFAGGRVAAVSVTDNPGGNPSLSPDVLGHNIFQVGLDVIVHYTSRDLNRVGMESRALQLAMMGMKNLLAITGDYPCKGYGGQAAPVFDLESVNAIMLLRQLSERIIESGDPDGFFVGCAVSPFKRTEAECFSQYNKLFRKILAGAHFIITQVGYNARKFAELMGELQQNGLHDIPVMGSIYVLNPKAAKIMNKGIIPGVVVSDELLAAIRKDWETPSQGRRMAIERAAKLGAILKGLGYRGMHIGGVHKNFDIVGSILDRMQEIESDWHYFYDEFDFSQIDGFYLFPNSESDHHTPAEPFEQRSIDISLKDKLHYSLMENVHSRFFTFESPFASVCGKSSRWLTQHKNAEKVMSTLEISMKKAWLNFHLKREHQGVSTQQEKKFFSK